MFKIREDEKVSSFHTISHKLSLLFAPFLSFDDRIACRRKM
jgi:hypothetical protein